MTEVKARRLNSLVECLDRAGAAGMTRRQFAECLGIKVSQYLTGLLETLITDGYARKEMDYSMYPPAWKYFPTSPDTN